MSRANIINNPRPELISISGTTTLDNSYIGKVVELTGSSASLYLPNPGYQQPNTLTILCSITSGDVAQILSPSGDPYLTMGRGEVLTLISNGSSWLIQNFEWIQSYVYAIASATQTLTDNTQALLETGNSTAFGMTFSSNVGTVLYGGVYKIQVQTKLNPPTLLAAVHVELTIDNGSPVIIGSTTNDVISGADQTITAISPGVYLNAGDTIYANITQTSGGTETIEYSPPQVYTSLNIQRIAFI